MALTDRFRSLAGRAGRVLTAFSSTAPAAKGFEVPSADAPRGDKNGGDRSLRSNDAMFGRVTYGAGPISDRYSSYPGSGVEPQQIWNLQLLRNNGYPQLWTELCEQFIERDGHLGGVIDTRRQSVAEKPFRVHSARRGESASDALAKVCERAVDKIENFDQANEDLLTAPAYGYAVSELVWDMARIKITPANGTAVTRMLKVPKTIEWVHWKHIRFDLVTDEPYLWLRDGEHAIPPHKFIFHDATGTGLIERRGFMGSCAWLSAAKRWSERDWLVYAKLFGIPNIYGTYPDNEDQYAQHRAEYQQILKDFGEGIPALVPDSLKVEISREPSARSSDVHAAIIGWANAEMSKRILGSTLTVEIGNVGAYAAADTHRDAPYMRSRADAKKLCGTLRRDLFRAFVEVNLQELASALGESPDDLLDSIPTCSRRIEKESSPTDRQKIYEGAVNELGLEVDEEQYRDEMGLDAPRPGGTKLRGRAETVSAGAALIPTSDASDGGVKNPDDKNDKKPPTGGSAPPTASAPPTP